MVLCSREMLKQRLNPTETNHVNWECCCLCCVLVPLCSCTNLQFPLTKLAFLADCHRGGDSSAFLPSLPRVILLDDFYPVLVIMDTSQQAMLCGLNVFCSVTVFRGRTRISHICLFIVLIILSWKHHLSHLLDRMWLLVDLCFDQSNSCLFCLFEKASV